MSVVSENAASQVHVAADLSSSTDDCIHQARLAPKLKKSQIVVVNLSGRGDKDMLTVGEYLGVEL